MRVNRRRLRLAHARRHRIVQERNEQIIRDRIIETLTHEGTEFLDVLPALRSGVRAGTERMFLRSGDMHPNEQGYRAIAAAIEPYVRRR